MKTEIINDINAMFKEGKNKWNFLNKGNVQIKVWIGKKECDLQVFKINNLTYGRFNYQNQTNTKKEIIQTIEKYLTY